MTEGPTPPTPDKCPGGQTDFSADNQPDDIPTTSEEFVGRHTLGQVSEMCETGLSPRILSGFLMQLLANHFSDPALILTPTLQEYVWTDDPTTSKIRITKDVHFNPKEAGLFPALVLKRQPIESKRVGIGDMSHARGNALDHSLVGKQAYSRIHQGGYQIMCVGESDATSEDLAQEVFDTLEFLSPAIVGTLPFLNFEVTQLGGQSPLSGTGTYLAVPVAVTYAYEYAWTLQPLAPRLKRLSIQTHTSA